MNKQTWIQAAALCIGLAIAAGASARADVARRKIEFTSANPAELTAKARG